MTRVTDMKSVLMDKRAKLLWQYVDKWAAEKPDAEAIVFGGLRMTWAQLAGAVDRTARALLELGVEKGNCVALVSMARPEFIITFMAAAKIGAIWTGLSPRFSVSETGRILRDCRPTVLITQDRHENANLVERALTFSFELSCIREILVIGDAPGGTLSFDAFTADPRPHMDTPLKEKLAQVSPDDEALLMFTSGSSGFPKGVLHTHRSIISNVEQEQELLGLSGDTRILLHFPINHVAADVEIGYCAVYSGACLVMQEGFDAGEALKIVDREGITLIGQVPAMYMLEIRDPAFATTSWNSVKTFVWGGSAASKDLLEALEKVCRRTGAHMLTGYGATEMGGFVTITRPGDSMESMRLNVGLPYRNCELRIVDGDRKPVEAGVVGEVAVKGPFLMKGYLNSPALTEEVLDKDGWYYSSDLGSMDKDGVLTLHGRRSEMFKSGGENAFPCEIETVLESHPAVLFAAVVAVPDDVFDEVAHAHVVTVPGVKPSADELKEWCAASLSQFKIPRVIRFHETMPLLPNGKVDKIKLRKNSLR